MPAPTPPTAQGAATARQILLDGLAHEIGVFEILNQVAPLHPRNNCAGRASLYLSGSGSRGFDQLEVAVPSSLSTR